MASFAKWNEWTGYFKEGKGGNNENTSGLGKEEAFGGEEVTVGRKSERKGACVRSDYIRWGCVRTSGNMEGEDIWKEIEHYHLAKLGAVQGETQEVNLT